MTGSGRVRHHVDPQGPPLVIPLAPTLHVTKASVGPMDNNVYVVDDGSAVVLIDAANDPDRLVRLIGQRELATIVTTHAHGDHWQGLPGVVADREAKGARPRLVAGAPDAAEIAEATGVGGIEGVWDGDVVAFGMHQIEVIGLVGHTPGSIALVLRPGDGPVQLFTGDALFPGGVGKTSGPAAFTRLLDDVTTKLFDRFDDETVVHPGHGDATTLGHERGQLPAWRARGW